MAYDLDMPPYIQEMADWLDNPQKVHQCNFDHACLGAEIMLALQRSAVEGGQIALPLASGAALALMSVPRMFLGRPSAPGPQRSMAMTHSMPSWRQ